MSIMEDVQDLDLGTIVELYDIDLTFCGFPQVLHFSPHTGGTDIHYGDNVYLGRGLEMTGFGKSSNNAPPEPSFTISNVDKGGTALLQDYDNLIGAQVTRRRTLAKYLNFLEDGVTPNPNKSWNSQFMPEIWYVEQKEEDNPILIKWRMKSIMDLEDVMVPARQVLKGYCKRRYRYWNPTTQTFVYPTVNACPYTGSSCFDMFNNPTTPDKDMCSKDHVGCDRRFDELPTWAFPGADRLPS